MARYGDLQLCRNKAGYEVLPEDEMHLDLDAAETTLEEAGWESLAHAGRILVVGRDTLEVSIFRKGKLLFKTKEKSEAEGAWGELRGELGL